MIQLVFLSADKRLTKTIILKPGGEWDSVPYPHVFACTSHEESITSIEEFYEVLLKHSQDGHALLKGGLIRPIQNESRAGFTAASTTKWLVIDFDGFDLAGRTLEDILVDMGLGYVDYILQYSASHGIKPGLSAHIFMLLERAIAPETLKTWLKSKNLSIASVRKQISLTRTNLALKLPIDICVADNSRIIYIGPAIFSGGADPVSERINLVKGTRRLASISTDILGDIDAQATELLQQLRKQKNLPDRKFSTKFVKTELLDVLVAPEKISITGEKADGDFVRVNVNGSSSWGYYYKKESAEVLFNFRGEPPVLLKECAPDYYRTVKNRIKQAKLEAHSPSKSTEEIQRWIINRADTGQYHKITYDKTKGVKIEPCPTAKHVTDFCSDHKILVPDIIQDWSVHFDPTSMEFVNAEKRTINTFRPSIYRINAVKNNQPIPQEYRNLIHHVCGCDDEATNHFINWLAYLFSTGQRPKTAWVWSGCPGTGKNRFSRCLHALFGEHYTSAGPEAISDKFNGFMKTAQLVFLDEMTSDAVNTEVVTPVLRALIDGETGLREMRTEWQNAELFFGLIIATNTFNAVEIRHDDRRFNIAPRQEVPLAKASWVYDEYALFDDNAGFLYQPENLQNFANALYSYAVDIVAVRRPLDNEAKRAVQRTTSSLPEDILNALTTGCASYFAEFVPQASTIPNMDIAMYTQLVDKMMRGGKVPMSIKDISKIFEFLAGWPNDKPGKFTKAAARYGLDLRGKTAREGTQVYAGTYFVFNPTEEDKAHWNSRTPVKLEVVRESRIQE